MTSTEAEIFVTQLLACFAGEAGIRFFRLPIDDQREVLWALLSMSSNQALAITGLREALVEARAQTADAHRARIRIQQKYDPQGTLL